MKTKPFLLATSGATVDGRNIEPDWLRQMAQDYDPKTYGARVNIEHIRGISGQSPFFAYGDVVELSVVENHEVKIGGKTEKRTALFGTLEVTDNAKQLNEGSQKVYPSIEVEPNFAGKGRAYLMGLALTDSPASIGTDKMQFSRVAPGHKAVSENEDLGALLEFADEAPKTEEAIGMIASFFSKLTDKLNGTPAPVPEQKPAATPETFDPAAFAKELGETITQAFTAQSATVTGLVTELQGKFTALEQLVEKTADPNFAKRLAAAAPGGAQHRTDC